MDDHLWLILLAAFILDYLFNDPDGLPHPIVYMGNAISFFEKPFRKMSSNLVWSGIVFAGFLIASTWMISFFLVKFAMAIHPVFGLLVQTVLLFFCFSSKSLEKAALHVYQALKQKDLPHARKRVGYIVGRQTDELDEPAITRATIETVAENFVDGFLSPLFFALIGGAPLALAYKMVNTLDSMVGYKNDTYLLFGRGAARIDDVANYIPARLSVTIISMAARFISSAQAVSAFKTGVSEGRQHKSPNAGFPEAAFAGALRIRLGGPSTYHGAVVEKPFIGKIYDDPKPFMIKQACDLMMLSSLCGIVLACLVLFLI